MLYQQTVNNTFTIPYDGIIEQFNSTFPISLVNRVQPNHFQSTLDNCNTIMKKHMERITKSDKMVPLVIFGLVTLMLFMTIFPTVMITTFVQVNEKFDKWIPVICVPIFACIGMFCMICYSYIRVKQIKLIHAECKKEIDEILAQENEMYFQLGVQWILRYDVEGVGKTRFDVYKHLTVMPCLEILVNPQMFVIPQQSSQPVVVEQQPTSMIYQQVNKYQKENNNQPLLGNRV